MSRWSNRALVTRHVRNRPGASLTVAALMVVLSAVAVMTPVALSAVADATIRSQVTGLSTLTRDVIASNKGTPQVEFDLHDSGTLMQPWEQLFTRLEAVREAQPEELRTLLGEPMLMTRFVAETIQGFPREANISRMLAPQLEARVTIVAGAAPAAPAPSLFDSRFGSLYEQETGAERATIEPVDVMLSAASAAEIDVTVGDLLPTARLDIGAMVPYRVSGIFVALDPHDDFWDHAQAVLAPSILIGENGPVPTVVAVLNPGALGLFARLQDEARTEAWYPLDVDAITAENAGAVLAQLRVMSAVTHEVGESGIFLVGVGSMRFVSDAIPAIETAIAEVRAIVAVVAVIASGPFGVAIAVLLLGCRMLVEQHRSALRLLAARGARPSQLRGLLALQGLVVGFVPAALGMALGLAVCLALSGGAVAIAWPMLVLPPVLAFAPAALLAFGGFRGLTFTGRTDMDAAATPTARRLRLLLEVATIALAIIATVLLLSRGIDAGAGTIAFDPLLAAAPLLLSLVACIIALRLYPLALRAMLRSFRRSSGFVGFLGAARALREPAAGLAPAFALIVGVAVAVSSGVLLSTVQQGVVTSARMQVGADIKLDAARFTSEQLEVIRSTEGVRDIATIAEERAAELTVDGKRRLVSAFIVDSVALGQVQPGGFTLIPEGISLAPSAATIPVLVSPEAERIWASSAQITVGDATISPVAVIESGTPLGARSNWMLLDSSAAEELFGSVPPARTALVAAAPGASVTALTEVLQQRLAGTAGGASVRIATADSMIAEMSAGPAVAGLRMALLLCIALVALLSAVAVVMTLVLGTRARERLLALLPSLGAPRRAGGVLAAWELWPAAASAVLVGAVFGAALPLLVLAAVDLRPFTGSPVQAAYVADPLVLGAAIGGFLVLTAVLTLAALAVSRRARAASVLRTVEEA